MDNITESYVKQLATILEKRGWTCATAESCTGGMVGAVMTALPGSSRWYKGGIIAYANSVKTTLLGVPESVLESHGAVSEVVAVRMAQGVCAALGTDIAIAITGVAGPDGGSVEKPVGTVWIGWAVKEQCAARCFLFNGDRDAVRHAAVEQALQGALGACGMGEG